MSYYSADLDYHYPDHAITSPEAWKNAWKPIELYESQRERIKEEIEARRTSITIPNVDGREHVILSDPVPYPSEQRQLKFDERVQAVGYIGTLIGFQGNKPMTETDLYAHFRRRQI